LYNIRIVLETLVSKKLNHTKPAIKILNRILVRSKIYFLAICLVIVSIVCAQANNIELPELGSNQNKVFSDYEEQLIGKIWLHQNFYSQTDQLRDFALQSYLEQLVDRIYQHVRLSSDPTVLLIENKQFNAFAAPGNIIGINTGLILQLDSEAALAAIIAHEVAHLSQNHISRRIQNSQSQSRAILLGMLLTVASILSNQGGEEVLAPLLVGQGIAQANLLKYSRSQEIEADRIGLNLLTKAGFDPYGMAKAHKTINQLSRSGYQIPEYLLTHPLSSRRLTDARSRINVQRLTQKEDDTYKLMQVNAIFIHNHPYDLVKKYAKMYDYDPKDMVAKYGYAKALVERNQLQQAEKLVQQLVNEKPIELIVNLQLTMLQKQKKWLQAKTIAESWIDTNGLSYSIAMTLASVCKVSKDYQCAKKTLNQLREIRPNDVIIWHELAEVYRLSGDILNTNIARAEYLFNTGYYKEALAQLEIAKIYIANDQQANIQINQRISEILEFIRFAQSISN